MSVADATTQPLLDTATSVLGAAQEQWSSMPSVSTVINELGKIEGSELPGDVLAPAASTGVTPKLSTPPPRPPPPSLCDSQTPTSNGDPLSGGAPSIPPTHGASSPTPSGFLGSEAQQLKRGLEAHGKGFGATLGTSIGRSIGTATGRICKSVDNASGKICQSVDNASDKFARSFDHATENFTKSMDNASDKFTKSMDNASDKLSKSITESMDNASGKLCKSIDKASNQFNGGVRLASLGIAGIGGGFCLLAASLMLSLVFLGPAAMLILFGARLEGTPLLTCAFATLIVGFIVSFTSMVYAVFKYSPEILAYVDGLLGDEKGLSKAEGSKKED